MIAYYIHHHGTGHVNRAGAIAAKLRIPVVGLSTREAPAQWAHPWIVLADDAGNVDAASDVTARDTLHWVPRRHPGLRSRMHAISSLLAGGTVRLLVSDVSTEVALLARLHGVPVVVMAQPGDRGDRAHRTAYDLADRLVAPWPSRPARPWPEAWLEKTSHVGAFSRYDDRPRPAPRPGKRRVLVLWGSGGVDVTRAQIDRAARATPQWHWQLAGPPIPSDGRDSPANVEDLGWVGDPWPALCRASVVVTHAGQNAISEVAAARAPAVVIPQHRPFGEQDATAAALRSACVATICPTWPEPEQWPGLLAQTARLGGERWGAWSMGDGAQRAASAIEECATP